MNKNLVLGLLLATTAPVLAEEAAPVVEAPEATRSVGIQGAPAPEAPKKQIEVEEATRSVEVAPEAPAAEISKNPEAPVETTRSVATQEVPTQETSN